MKQSKDRSLQMLFVGLVIIALATAYSLSRKKSPTQESPTVISTGTPSSSPIIPASAVDGGPVEGPVRDIPLHPTAKADPSETSAQERRSLNEMSRTLFIATQTSKKMADVIGFLSRTKQQPTIAKDSNPHTGDMFIIRTMSPLPGTRYFHAQYFGDRANEPFVQHMSFEFRPGQGAFEEAQRAVQAAFPQARSPTFRNVDFIQWDVGQGYVVWIKRMGPRDLEENPFNAYSLSDIGTIRVAVELDIHHH